MHTSNAVIFLHFTLLVTLRGVSLLAPATNLVALASIAGPGMLFPPLYTLLISKMVPGYFCWGDPIKNDCMKKCVIGIIYCWCEEMCHRDYLVLGDIKGLPPLMCLEIVLACSKFYYRQ